MIYGDGGHASVVREFYQGEGWIVAIGDNRNRMEESKKLDGSFGIAIHPKAIISPSATVGDGSVIMAGAVVQTGARVGRHCILNSNSVLDHHAVLEDYAHIAPGAAVCGGAHIGQGAFIGVNASVVQYVRVPAWYLVKANSVFFYSRLKGEESFWVKADRTSGCWIWTALKNAKGYGVVNYQYKTQLAHRLAWTLTHGPIPHGLYACHKCDTPACINPDHLFLGTQFDNMRDMAAKGRSRRGRKFPKVAA